MYKLFELEFGSTLYNTRTENSDLDLKSVYLPNAREIVLGSYPKNISTQRPKREFERNNKDDIDIEVISFDRFLRLLGEGQTMALDIFFGVQPHHLTNWYSTWIWNELHKNKDKLLCKDATSFISYSRTQAAKYGIKGSRMEALSSTLGFLSTLNLYTKLGDHEEQLKDFVSANSAIISLEKTPLIQIKDLLAADKKTLVPHLEICNRKLPFGANVKFCIDVLLKIYEGYGHRAQKAHLDGGKDYKALSHSVRVNSEALELLKTGHITFPRPDAELLTKIKKREVPFEEISTLIEQGLVNVTEAAKVSTLRESADQNYIDNFVADVYTQIVCNDHAIFEDWEMKDWTRRNE